MKHPIVRTTILLATAQFAILDGTFITDVEALSNRALAASPRAREEFPGLIRRSQPARDVGRVEIAALNPAPPRIREENPALDRTFRVRSFEIAPQGVASRGLAANPRALEENPMLARGVRIDVQDTRFQVAPLK